MTAIPLFIILYLQICSPGFLDPLYEGFFGRIFMTGAFFVYLGAAAWSRHLMKIEC
jgi:tight adherence protein B